MTEWLETVRYRLGCWLVPETAQLNDVLVQLERSNGIVQAQEQEIQGLESEKGILLGQMEFLRKTHDAVTAQFDVIKSMADRFYGDLKDSQQRFNDYTTGHGTYARTESQSVDPVPDMIHPEYAAQMLADMITREADSMYDDDMGPPVSKRSH